MTAKYEGAELKAAYDRDGFVVVEDLLSADECDRLLAEAAEIGRGNRGDVRGITKLPDDLDDTEVLSRYLTVQFPHKASDLIRDEFIAHPEIARVLSHLIGPNVKCMQSMLFIKPSGK
ncbi:MAG: phytanoyl-CoA dioxygenase family protein, partial [Alphaproteobacteria bacterium]